MKKIVAALLSLLLAVSLAACGSKSYLVTMKNGQRFTSSGYPDYDVQSETYKFKNDEGKEVILNQADIEVIQEVDKK